MSTPDGRLRVPDLEMGDEPITLSLWLVEAGAEVSEGDRLAELLAGPVTIDLPAPISGMLRRMLAAEDERVRPGQLLAIIEPVPESGLTP